jgi:hypothetical protein
MRIVHSLGRYEMVGVEDAVEIDRPVTEVFAALADPNVQITSTAT